MKLIILLLLCVILSSSKILPTDENAFGFIFTKMNG